VKGKVVRSARERKKIVFRYHSKTRYDKMKGHRQHFTEVEISKI
jgi:ribosomal protein L21